MCRTQVVPDIVCWLTEGKETAADNELLPNAGNVVEI